MPQITSHILIASLLLSLTMTPLNASTLMINHETEIIPDIINRLLKHSEQLTKNTDDYIQCLQQHNPDLAEKLRADNFDNLIQQLENGTSSLKSCQFLLDELLKKLPDSLPQPTAESAELQA